MPKLWLHSLANKSSHSLTIGFHGNLFRENFYLLLQVFLKKGRWEEIKVQAEILLGNPLDADAGILPPGRFSVEERTET